MQRLKMLSESIAIACEGKSQYLKCLHNCGIEIISMPVGKLIFYQCASTFKLHDMRIMRIGYLNTVDR